MGVRSLGLEDLLEEGVATHPSILAWRIPWMKEPGGLQSKRSQEKDTTEMIQQACTSVYLTILQEKKKKKQAALKAI